MFDQLLGAGVSIAGAALQGRARTPGGPVISGSGRGAELNADGWTVSFGNSTATGATVRRTSDPMPVTTMPGELPGLSGGATLAGGGILPWIVGGALVLLIARKLRPR